MVEWRNLLAHRYLVARLAQGATLKPQQAHIDELAQLADTFQAAVKADGRGGQSDQGLSPTA
jgi:hypothetical protein